MIIKPNKKEILRYLGVKGEIPNEILEQIDILTKELQQKITPRHIYKRLNCSINDNIINIDNITIKSKNLANHINGCNEIILLSATLSIVADNLLRRYSVTDIAKAAILQAISAAMIEEYCDQIEKEIADNLLKEDLYLTTRFSPGYGDFPITHQKDILDILECNKKIGLTLSESYMLSPTKSVTAIMGITNKKCLHKDKCLECNNINCPFRNQ